MPLKMNKKAYLKIFFKHIIYHEHNIYQININIDIKLFNLNMTIFFFNKILYAKLSYVFMLLSTEKLITNFYVSMRMNLCIFFTCL